MGDIENPELKGLIPRITEQIFESILNADSTFEYTVKVSYMEIYMERIKDLLARELARTVRQLMAAQNDNLSVHEDKTRGVYVKNLSEYYVSSEEEVYKVMKAGGSSRAVSSTSESQLIFLVFQADRRHER